MIPKLVHYIWLGNKPIYDKYINTNYKYLSDYDVKIWTDKDFTFNESTWVRETYEQNQLEYCSDALRWYIINKYGGFYFDIDVEIRRKINEDILDLNYYLCHERFDFPRITTAIIGGVKNSIVTNKFLNFYNNTKFITNDSYLCVNDTDRSEPLLKELPVVWNVFSVKEAKYIEQTNRIPIFAKEGGEDYNVSLDYSFSQHHHDRIGNKLQYNVIIKL